MAEPIQLLNINQQHTAQAFGQINSAITAGFNRQEEARQFDAQLLQRGTEFGVEMAFKDRALQEEIAFNMLRAEEIKFGAELDAARFEMEKQLQPDKQAAARLQLETQKEINKRAIEASKKQQFDIITGPQDSRVAGALAGTRNSDLGNGYLSIKSKYQGIVGSGGTFDERAFTSEVDALIATYADQKKETAEYDPELATLMDRMGATAEAARYRAENPIFAGSLPGIKANMLLADDKIFDQNLQNYGFMFKGQELPAIAAVRNSLTGYRSTITQKEQEKQSRIRASGFYDVKSDPTGVEKQKNAQRIAELDAEITTITKAHDALFNKTVGFDIQDVTPPTEKSQAEKDYFATLTQIKKETTLPQNVAPDSAAPSLFDKNKTAIAAERNIPAYTAMFPEVMGDKISFKTWQGINPRKSPEYAKSLRSKILENMETLPLDKNEAKTEGEPTIEKLIQSESFKNVFKELDGNAVEFPRMRNNQRGNLQGPNTTSIGNRNPLQWMATGGLDSGTMEIESYEEFMKAVEEFEGTADQKRDYIQKMYASVVAAGAINRFSQGKN